MARLITNNLLFNGNFEKYPTLVAATTSGARWIDGTALGTDSGTAYGWACTASAIGAPASAMFDTSVKRSGSCSMKLSTGSSAGTVTVGSYKSATPLPREVFPLLGNTSYTIRGYIKTTSAHTDSVFIDFRQLNSSLGAITTASSTKFTGTNDWTLVTITITTQPTTVAGIIFLRNNVAGADSSAWFDDITVELTTPTARTVVS